MENLQGKKLKTKTVEDLDMDQYKESRASSIQKHKVKTESSLRQVSSEGRNESNRSEF